MSQTVLVTGATGKTGRPLLPQLLDRGVTVRAGSRTPKPAISGVEPVHFDWSIESTYGPASKGADAIYLAPSDLSNPGGWADQVATLLGGAAEAGVQRVVLLSAFGVDRAPADDPMRRMERVVENSGIPATIVRPGAFMQNFSEMHWSHIDKSIREQDEIAMPGGDGLVAWVSTRDIAAVVAAALTEDGHTGKGYSVMGPELLTMPQVVGHISAAVGRPITYIETGLDEVRAGLIAAGMPSDMAGPVGEMYVMALTTGAFGVLTDDVATVTGRTPVTFADYAAGAVRAWLR